MNGIQDAAITGLRITECYFTAVAAFGESWRGRLI